MTTLHLLVLAAYFLCLYEYIAMRHRVICAESDAGIRNRLYLEIEKWTAPGYWVNYTEAVRAKDLYRNRGTK